jgi:hypothetical protein
MRLACCIFLLIQSSYFIISVDLLSVPLAYVCTASWVLRLVKVEALHPNVLEKIVWAENTKRKAQEQVHFDRKFQIIDSDKHLNGYIDL